MDIARKLFEVDDYKKSILDLLKKQEYAPQGVVLTTEERNKLYEFLYKYSITGMKSYRYDYSKIGTIENYNEFLFENIDDETKALIEKIGANPKAIFLDNDSQILSLDTNISRSLKSHGTAQAGQYTINVSKGHPVLLDSDELKDLSEKDKQKKHDKFKDGACFFKVSTEVNGERKEIYVHKETVQIGDYVLFKNEQIGGEYNFTKIVVSPMFGPIRTHRGIINNLDELLVFFKDFENSLKKNIEHNNDLEPDDPFTRSKKNQ